MKGQQVDGVTYGGMGKCFKDVTIRESLDGILTSEEWQGKKPMCKRLGKSKQ